MAARQIGQTAVLNGKKVVWSGNHGWQSPASHNKLRDQGKFKLGAQALDRIGSSIPKPLKDAAAELQRRASTGPIQPINAGYKGPNATERVLQGASDKLNLDRRIVDGAANLTQAAISRKLLGGNKPVTSGNNSATAVTKPRTTPRQSVGAAAAPAPTTRQLPRTNRPGTVQAPRPSTSSGAKPPKPASTPGKPLGGESKQLGLTNTYHGTSARDAQSIRANGYRPSATGVYGPGVYTGNKAMAKTYADSAGIRAGDGGRVLRHRVPTKTQKTVPFEKPEGRQRVSPQADLVQQRLRQGKTTRVDYGKGSQVTNLTKAQADKTLVKPNGNIRLSKGQQAKAKSRSERLSHGSVSRSEAGYFKPGSRPVNTEQLAKNIERQLQQNRNGFTVDPRTGKNPTRGTQVSIDGQVLRDTSPAGIRRFVERNKAILSRSDTKVGVWKSERSGKPVLEISRRVRDTAEAERLGKKFQQEGVWDSKRGQYVATGGSDQLRHTKGAQTKGGSRIGGQTATARLKVNRQGTVKAPVRATTNETQATQGKRKVNLGDIQRGQRNFTPARRAEANLRRVENPRNMLKEQGPFTTRVSPGTNKYVSTRETPGPRNARTHKPAFSRHDLSFDYVRKPEGNDVLFGQRKELGKSPVSRVKSKRDSATTKALVGEQVDKQVKVGDELTAYPTTKARGRLYRSASNGALRVNSDGDIQVKRTGTTRWQDVESSIGKDWNPAELKRELKKLSESAATRVGRRAGGTSNAKARISKARNQLKVKKK